MEEREEGSDEFSQLGQQRAATDTAPTTVVVRVERNDACDARILACRQSQCDRGTDRFTHEHWVLQVTGLEELLHGVREIRGAILNGGGGGGTLPPHGGGHHLED